LRWFAVGQSPTGVIAIGQVPTGLVAIGQGATGVVAIGQLARGVIALGQLAVGVVAFGQVSLGAAWSGGMLSVGGVEGPTLLGTGLFGRLPLTSLLRLRIDDVELRAHPGRARWIAICLWLAIAGLVWITALGPLLHDLTRVGGILRDPPPPRVLR
jgi:hypothetical protein